MKQLYIKLTLALSFFMAFNIAYSQRISKKRLDSLIVSNVPYMDRKGDMFPTLYGIKTPKGISDKLYEDLQCTKYFNVGDNEDLQPALYLRINIANSRYVIGAMYFGGATDYRTDIVFVADKMGVIKSALEGTILNGGVSIKQYKVTEDYKIITSQMIPTSHIPILFENFIGSGQPIEAYRLNTTYHINDNGEFIKENETRLPTKTYTEKQLTENDIWDL